MPYNTFAQKKILRRIIKTKRNECITKLTKTEQNWQILSKISTEYVLLDLDELKNALENDTTMNLDNFRAFFTQYHATQDPLNPFCADIALTLYHANTMQDLLRALLPPSVRLIAPKYTVLSANQNDPSYRKRSIPMMYVEKKDLCELPQAPASVAALQHFVFVDNLLFDMREIANYNFKQHQNFYSQIQTYDRLMQAIYSHNSVLKTLKTNLDNDTVYLPSPL